MLRIIDKETGKPISMKAQEALCKSKGLPQNVGYNFTPPKITPSLPNVGLRQPKGAKDVTKTK